MPLRYYHRPNARDDNHGYGKQSRFLTTAAEALCERNDTYAAQPDSPAPSDPARVRVEVDLASLWQ